MNKVKYYINTWPRVTSPLSKYLPQFCKLKKFDLFCHYHQFNHVSKQFQGINAYKYDFICKCSMLVSV